MKIAVAASTSNLSGIIDERLSLSNYLLILHVNEEHGKIEIEKSYKCNASEKSLSSIILNEGCEAIISGIIDKVPFNALADQYITRYDGKGYNVDQAIQLMLENKLELFVCSEEEDRCEGHGHTL